MNLRKDSGLSGAPLAKPRFLARLLCVGLLVLPCACDPSREKRPIEATGSSPQPVRRVESAATPPAVKKESSAAPKEAPKAAKELLTAEQFCSREKAAESRLLKGATSAEEWHGDCVVDGTTAWTKRLEEASRINYTSFSWRLIRYRDGKELGTDRYSDDEHGDSGTLILSDVIGDARAEVFWSNSHDDGNSFKAIAEHGGALVQLQGPATGIREGRVIVDTSLVVSPHCDIVYDNWYKIYGPELAYRRTPSGFELDPDSASALDDGCPNKASLVQKKRGRVDVRDTWRSVVCALRAGKSEEAVRKELEMSCKNAEPRDSCTDPLPEGSCEGWKEVLGGVPLMSKLLVRGAPVQLFTLGPPMKGSK